MVLPASAHSFNSSTVLQLFEGTLRLFPWTTYKLKLLCLELLNSRKVCYRYYSVLSAMVGQIAKY